VRRGSGEGGLFDPLVFLYRRILIIRCFMLIFYFLFERSLLLLSSRNIEGIIYMVESLTSSKLQGPPVVC